MNSASTPDNRFLDLVTKHQQAASGLESAAIEHKVSTKNLYVVWSEEKLSVLHDPMTNKPVNASNPKHLEAVAKAFKGTVIPAHSAIQKLLKGAAN